MPIGTVWEDDTWDDDAWEDGTWADVFVLAVILILSDVRSLTPALLAMNLTPALTAANLTPDLTAAVME